MGAPGRSAAKMPRRQGVMGPRLVAHDPSAPDYGGTSPASPGRRMKERACANALLFRAAARRARSRVASGRFVLEAPCHGHRDIEDERIHARPDARIRRTESPRNRWPLASRRMAAIALRARTRSTPTAGRSRATARPCLVTRISSPLATRSSNAENVVFTSETPILTIAELQPEFRPPLRPTGGRESPPEAQDVIAKVPSSRAEPPDQALLAAPSVASSRHLSCRSCKKKGPSTTPRFARLPSG